MRMSGLSLESMPPLSIPLRFFLTAPWFGVLAAILFFFQTDMIQTGRWSLETLAFTHLITLGVMMMVMVGALFQFIPVITGYAIPGTRVITPIVHISLIIGTLCLVAGFLWANSVLFQIAISFLLVAVGVFASALTLLLLNRIIGKESLFLLRLVNLALFVTLGLGIYMAAAYAFPEWGIAMRRYTDLHMVWGLLGWTILLIMTVSSQVIPMFHVTPAFPAVYLKSLSSVITIILIALSLIYLNAFHPWAKLVGELIFSGAILFFAVYTLYMLQQRKRKVKDITINFWRLALIMPILSVCLYWLQSELGIMSTHQSHLMQGLLIIFGLTLSSIMGMIQKIASFIAYLHLQRLSMQYPNGMAFLPNMQTLISVKNQEIQFYLHIATLVGLMFAIFFKSFGMVAALLMAADFLWLGYNMSRCGLTYRDLVNKIKAA